MVYKNDLLSKIESRSFLIMHRVKNHFALYYLIFVLATHNLVSMLQVGDAV